MDFTRRFKLPSSTLLCRTEFFQELAEQAKAGYCRAPRGGPETGGLLLGTRYGERVQIRELKPMVCAHEFGPEFHLSPTDREALHSLLESLAKEPNVEVVGWYHTTSKELAMDSESKRLTEEFFFEPWQVALVIRRWRSPRSVETQFGLFAQGTSNTFDAPVTFTLAELPQFPEVEEPRIQAETQSSMVLPKAHHAESQPAEAQSPEAVPTESASPEASTTAVYPGSVPEPITEPPSRPVENTPPAASSLAWKSTRPRDPRSAAEFFGFREDPFIGTPDPAYYCDIPSHLDVLASLGYGVWSRKGVLLLTGEAGYGKTMLLGCLAQDLKKDGTQFSLLSPAPSSVNSLCQLVAKDLELSVPATGKSSLPIALWARGTQCLEQGRNLAILVDDAHKLDSALLSEIEALSTFGTRREKLVQLVMTADASFEDKLNDPPLRAFAQQITMRTKLSPLDVTETAAYIDLHLTRAGVTPGAIVPPEVATAVFHRTSGVPRKINAVCSAALKVAFEQRQPVLTVSMVAQAHLQPPIGDPADQPAQAFG